MNRRFEGRRWSGAFGARGRAVLLACVGLALALGLVATSAAGPPPSFAKARNYATGEGPDSVAIGDLGEPQTRTPGTVSVSGNRGDGSFRQKLDYRPGKGPSSVAIGDLNRDGKLDLATANTAAGTVSVFVNRGDGRFKPRRDYA